MEILGKFLSAVKRYSLLKKKDKVILGISGGPDSVAMLHLFSHIKREFKLYLVCVHFNHGLRKEADEEEIFVKRLADSLNIKFVSERKNVGGFWEGNSLEQVARNLRYDFFFKVANTLKIKKIALAHTKDDVVETVLMRVIRGAGIQGLRGILPLIKLKRKTFIRPLIEMEKEEIIKWLKEKKIEYRVDSSNFEERFFRNKIRLNILPLLKKLNPNIKNNLFNLARLSAWNYDFVTKLAYKELEQVREEEGKDFLILNLERLKRLHPFLFLQVLRLAIEEIKGDTRRLDWRHFEKILEAISKKNIIIDLPRLIVEINASKLTLRALSI
ncbi:MAG: tRNA lysidine(34) synthetase TilS [Candidatus Omnitrophica bacterium 4484_70.2]|nr:MAG: tRNA lysidine(34) synthetase TilS [Candidatus Omnitrophica bacterium 4484_70.2]